MKTNGVAVCFLLVAGIISQGSALTCYSCEDCPFSDEPVSLTAVRPPTTQCDDELAFDFTGMTEPRCVKEVKRSGDIHRYCSTRLTCKALELDKCSDADEVSCALCCESDRCNSAPNVEPAWLLITLVIAVMLCVGLTITP